MTRIAVLTPNPEDRSYIGQWPQVLERLRATLAATLERDFNFRSVIGVVSVFADKDARAMLESLRPVLSEVVVTRNSSPRAMEADDLAAVAYEVFGDDLVRVEEHFGAALELAVELAEEQGPEGVGVLATGSVATAGDARAYFRTYRP